MYDSRGGRSSDFFFVSLYSNSSEFHPKNTPSNFTNKLHRSIELPRHEGWQMALYSLYCNNHFNDAWRVNDVSSDGRRRLLSQVNVRCAQVSGIYDAECLISGHSRQAFDVNKCRLHSYEPTHLQFYTLVGESVTELSIQLLDSSLNILKYRRSQPTVCTLIFRKNMGLQHLPLWIHSRNEKHPDNKAANFKLTLPPIFTNTGDFKWQVAVTSFTFVPKFASVPYAMLHDKRGLIIDLVDLSDEAHPFNALITERTLHIPTSDYRRISHTNWPSPPAPSEGESQFRLRGDNWNWLSSGQVMAQGVQNLLQYPKFKSIVELVRANPGPEVDQRAKIKFLSKAVFYLPIFIAHILGFREYAVTDNGTLAVFAGHEGDVFLARQMIDISALSPQSLALVCDFIEPTFVGAVQSPVLKTIPVKFVEKSGAVGSSITYEPKNLEYHPLNTRELSSMHFQIIDASGDQVQFEDFNQNIILGLTIKTR